MITALTGRTTLRSRSSSTSAGHADDEEDDPGELPVEDVDEVVDGDRGAGDVERRARRRSLVSDRDARSCASTEEGGALGTTSKSAVPGAVVSALRRRAAAALLGAEQALEEAGDAGAG